MDNPFRPTKPNSFADLLKRPEPKPEPPNSFRALFSPTPLKTFPFSGAFINAPAVYVIRDASHNVIYVGETTDLCQRIKQHRSDMFHSMHRRNPAWVEIEFGYEDEARRKARERELILRYSPPCNQRL